MNFDNILTTCYEKVCLFMLTYKYKNGLTMR